MSDEWIGIHWDGPKKTPPCPDCARLRADLAAAQKLAADSFAKSCRYADEKAAAEEKLARAREENTKLRAEFSGLKAECEADAAHYESAKAEDQDARNICVAIASVNRETAEAIGAGLATPPAAPEPERFDYRAAYEEIVVRCRQTPGRCFCGVHITPVCDPAPVPPEEQDGEEPSK